MGAPPSPPPHAAPARRTSLAGMLGWLRAHPLVWLVPLVCYGLILAWVVFRLASAPRTEFIYDI